MMRFEGKTVLITGGRSGIGRATAERFADEGARVFTAQRGEDDQFESIIADLADPAAPQAVIDQVTLQTGRLDVLVNNAGIMQEASIEDMPLEDWMQTIIINPAVITFSRGHRRD